MRKEFEDWSATHYYLGGCEVDVEDGEYKDPDMQYAWEGWKASRESLVIELPTGGYFAGHDNEHMMESRDVREAIEAAGLKVKP